MHYGIVTGVPEGTWFAIETWMSTWRLEWKNAYQMRKDYTTVFNMQNEWNFNEWMWGRKDGREEWGREGGREKGGLNEQKEVT